MDTFPPGTRVIFYEGDRAQFGVVKAIETVENMQVAVIKVDGSNQIVKIPINVLTRDG